MKKKIQLTDSTKIVVVFALLLVIAFISDVQQENAIQNGAIERELLGGEEKEISLTLDVEGLVEEEAYTLEIPAVQPTEQEAKEYMEKAIKTIEKDFGEVGENVPIRSVYEKGRVEADWLFTPYGVVDAEGNICFEKVEETGTTVNVQVKLSCGAYEQIHSFAFLVTPKKLTEREALLQQVQDWMEKQMSLEGSKQLELPTKVNGHELIWSEEREYLTPQILFLEVVVMALFWIISKRKKLQEQQTRMLQMEREYPEIVNQLSLLLGAGMTTRQAWNNLASQYTYKKKAGMVGEKEVYEAILRINRRFSEGESERVIYQQFSQEIPALCYHKLMRLLLGNLEKGNQGICNRLEEESRVAYEQRIQQAKKLGEEASTKMLLPLMLMLVLVMGIVMLPAIIEFQI